MNRHSSSDENDIRQGHGEVHREIHEILEDLLVDEAVRAPETAAPVIVALQQTLAPDIHDAIKDEHAGSNRDSLEEARFIGHLREHLEDAASVIEANPIARDEDQCMSQHAVGDGVAPSNPPSQGVVGDGLCLWPRLPGAEAHGGALLRDVGGLRLPANVEIDESREQQPNLGGQNQVRLLQADPMCGAEGRPHEDKGGQVPHCPIEIQDEPQDQEERLTIRQPIRAHGTSVVETVQKREGGPTTPTCELQNKELDRAPCGIERPAGDVEHGCALREEGDRVTLDDNTDEDGTDVVQHTVLGGSLTCELAHLPQAVELHDRLGPITSLRGLGQRLLVDLAIRKPRQLLQALKQVGDHVRYETLLAMVPEIRRQRGHNVGHELVFIDCDHSRLHRGV
mmetsp:Transcript_82408/g.207364  ORF Transcript_82408/g.207364 Transcript_82408/m.207364 type:complete len:396 (+) Transcript_82408:521-1708(+)